MAAEKDTDFSAVIPEALRGYLLIKTNVIHDCTNLQIP